MHLPSRNGLTIWGPTLMFRKERIFYVCAMVVALGLSFNANACSVSQWDTKVGITDVDAGSPPPIARVEKFCALAITVNETYVQDESPIDAQDTRIRLRFYVLVDVDSGDTSEVTLVDAFSDDAGSTPAFSIAYTSSGADMLSFRPAGGSPLNVAAPTGWIFVEVDWEAGVGFKFWVNTEPTETPSGDAGAGTATHVGMVRLGSTKATGLAANGTDINKLTYDSYQANRTTAVGGLMIGDANGNGAVNSTDVSALLIETELGGALAGGVPDCNMNGIVNSTDASCILVMTEL